MEAEIRLAPILDDACAGRITAEAAYDAITADPAIYKAASLRMIRDVLRRPSRDKVFTDAELLERLAKGKHRSRT